MDVEHILGRAYETWKQNAYFLTLVGFLSYAFMFLIMIYPSSLVSVSPNGIVRGDDKALFLFFVFYTIAVLIQSVLLIGAAYLAQDGETSLDALLRFVRKRGVHVALSALIMAVPFLLGLLFMNLLMYTGAAMNNTLLIRVSIVPLFVGLILSVLLVLAPYYAVREDWASALEKSVRKAKKYFVTLFLLVFLFGSLAIFSVFIHPLFFLIFHAAFLAHVANFTFLEICRARR